jgi:hypothetical protein
MKQEIVDAYANCIIALKDLTPYQALDILNNLRSALIKSHSLETPKDE